MKGIKKLTKYKLRSARGSGPIKGARKKKVEKDVEARGGIELCGRERLVERGVERGQPT